MIVKDNLLYHTTLQELESKIKRLPFYYSDHKVYKGDHTDCLVNLTYIGDEPKDSIFNFLHSIFNCPLDIVSWWRIRINITFKQLESKIFGWHTDWGSVGYKPQFENMYTALFYLNDTNGPTVFKDSDDKIDCVKNRLLIFNSCMEHSGTSHTEGDNKRVVINMNYF